MCHHCASVHGAANLAGEAQTWDFIGIGAFLCFGSSMAGVAAITLLWPGTILDRAWELNLNAYQQLIPVRHVAGPLFFLLSVFLLLSAFGWFQRRRWGWTLAVAVISVQVLGDIINLLRGDWLKGTVGVVVAGALLFHLLTPRIRQAFRQSGD